MCGRPGLETKLGWLVGFLSYCAQYSMQHPVLLKFLVTVTFFLDSGMLIYQSQLAIY